MPNLSALIATLETDVQNLVGAIRSTNRYNTADLRILRAALAERNELLHALRTDIRPLLWHV